MATSKYFNGNVLPEKGSGFVIDISPSWEAEKADREKSEGKVAARGQEVWRGDDPRWLMRPPYGFTPFTLRFGGACVYCAVHIVGGTRALYSRKIQSVAHVECHAGFDREVPEGGIEPVKKFPGGWLGEVPK